MDKRLARLPILALVLLAGCAFPPNSTSTTTKTSADATMTAIAEDPCAFVVPTLANVPSSAIHPAPTQSASSANPTPPPLQGPISQIVGTATRGSSFFLYGGSDLAFTSPDDGWIVGTIRTPTPPNGGLMPTAVSFHVVNGQVTRVPVLVHGNSTGVGMFRIAMVSATEGWALASIPQGLPPSGGGSTILHLKNGKWTVALDLGALPLMGSYSGPGADHGDGYFSDIAMVSADEGWAVGISGDRNTPIIAHYTKGTWTEASIVDEIGTGFIQHISMADADHGIGVGGNSPFPNASSGTLLNYEQGTWMVASSDNIDWYGVQMLSPTEGWATGQGVTVPGTPTADGATSYAVAHYCNGQWSIAFTDLPVTAGPFKMVSHSEGWLSAGGSVGSGSSSQSIDTGMLHYLNGKWSYMSLPASCSGVSTLDMLSAQQGWALCFSGEVLHYQGSAWDPA